MLMESFSAASAITEYYFGSIRRARTVMATVSGSSRQSAIVRDLRQPAVSPQEAADI
jgi:hypothetical protein